ncbi:MAG: hypothetical protein ACTSRU_00710 [Candidatus Hodarchaeales archaeon]
MKYLYLILLISLTACSPVKRLNRLIDKHPELIRTETVTIRDTVEVVVPEVKHDTMFLEKSLHDTVFIQKDRLKIKIWKVSDTIRVEGECETDTIRLVREIEVPVKYYKDDYKWWHKIPWWVYFLIFGTGGYFLYVKFKHLIK